MTDVHYENFKTAVAEILRARLTSLAEKGEKHEPNDRRISTASLETGAVSKGRGRTARRGNGRDGGDVSEIRGQRTRNHREIGARAG